jgi:hypothetical protein
MGFFYFVADSSALYAFQFKTAWHEEKKKLVFPKGKQAAKRSFELESVLDPSLADKAIQACYNRGMANELEKQWIAAWKRAGAKLAELEREELPLIDTQKSLMNLACAYESSRLHHQPSATSGLVEQQRWFRKLRP